MDWGKVRDFLHARADLNKDGKLDKEDIAAAVAQLKAEADDRPWHAIVGFSVATAVVAVALTKLFL